MNGIGERGRVSPPVFDWQAKSHRRADAAPLAWFAFYRQSEVKEYLHENCLAHCGGVVCG